MGGAETLDFEPIARQVYDDFLLSLSGVPVEGLFRRDGQYFIVSPALGMKRDEGRTVAEWFDAERRPLAHPIFLVDRRPEGAEELASRTADEVQSAFGVVRTANDIIRDLAVRLPLTFPLLSVGVEDRLLVITVSRPLDRSERVQLDSAVAATGAPLPLSVRVDGGSTGLAGNGAVKAAKFELAPARLRPDLPAAVRSFLEEDEACWRDHFRRAWSGDLTAEQLLGDGRRPADGSACLVATTFRPGNIRSYLSLYNTVVLVVPLEGRVEDALDGLGITRRELVELAARKKVLFVAPQSVERYDAAFLAALVEVGSWAVTGSRRLAAAVHADQVTRNPLLVLPGTALDRRTVLRALRRLAEARPEASDVMLALADGLANAWPFYEHSLHVRGAMASIAGPLAHVSRELARRLTGNDYFIELGAAAQNVEWASALGAHFAPFESDEYTELGHAKLLVAIHGGVLRDALPLARASEFEVAEELLVVDSDVDVLDFVTTLGEGDMARFRGLVRGIARPGRPAEEIDDLVAKWNRQVRAYERRPDRLKSMGLGGLLLGTAAKLAGAPDIVSLSAAVLPGIPALLTYVQEDLVGERASLGTVLDGLNARLATVPREAVLLARLKKLVKGMKS
jgi:hypothetical protein